MKKITQVASGYSLLELIVVVAVIAILSAISIPAFSSLIKQALYVYGKSELRNAHASCLANKSIRASGQLWGASFSFSNSSSKCSGTMSAAYEGGCQISINLSSGRKTAGGQEGWPSSPDECSNQALLVNQQSTNPKSDKSSQESFGSQASNSSQEDESKHGGSANSLINKSGERRLPGYEIIEHRGATMSRLASCHFNRQIIKTDAGYEPSVDLHPFLPKTDGINPPSIFMHRGDNLGNTMCKAVRIPASHFEGGILPRPFEVKMGRGIFPANTYDAKEADNESLYPEGSIYPQNLFDSEGYPLAIINPKRQTQWLEEIYPDIDLSTISSGICDPRRGPAGQAEDCQIPADL